jgi:hypothetical protein
LKTCRDAAKPIAICLVTAILGNLVWETGQLPLYTLWWNGTDGQILKALLHCTAGDALIAGAALALASAGARLAGWPFFGLRMRAVAILIGFGYTIFSEWLNVDVLGRWAYTPSMPVVPVLGTGVAPLLQWLVVPSVAFAVASAFRDRDAT